MPNRWNPAIVRETKQLVESLTKSKLRHNIVKDRTQYVKPLTDEQLEKQFMSQFIENEKEKDPEHTRLNRFSGDMKKEDDFRQKLKNYKQYFSNIKFNANSNNSDKRYKILIDKLYTNVLNCSNLNSMNNWLNGFEDLIEERRS